jgi:hypothetical protein
LSSAAGIRVARHNTIINNKKEEEEENRGDIK